MDSPFFSLLFLIFLVAFAYLYDIFVCRRSHGKDDKDAKRHVVRYGHDEPYS
jgi:hypothetical protein